MNPFRLPFSAILALILLFTSACGSAGRPASAPPVPRVQPSAAPTPDAGPATPAASSLPLPGDPPAPGGSPAVLLFGIGMHIEPLGATVSPLVDGAAPPAGSNPRKPDYTQPLAFERGAEDIQVVAQIVERHAGRLTIQAQTPFTQMAIENGNDILTSLARGGHEMALHFHEDAHLGKQPENLPVETWCAVMKAEIAALKQAAQVGRVRYWSGGNLYPQLYQAAACAGLDVNSDWKNPHTQTTPAELTGIHPWRPAGGTDGQDTRQFARNDPQGAVIYLPEGLYARQDFAAMRRSQNAGGDQAYFDFLKQSLLDSLAAAQPGQANVFHFTIHPGEFRGDPAQPFAVIERFLSEVVDPLVASGQVRWATFSEMADAYQASQQPASAETRPQATVPASQQTPGYISFIVNVHDWTHSNESADTLLRLVDLFERYGVRGDFYFTAPVVEQYVQARPDLIERLKNSNMTISYHIRPPHPLYPGFDRQLRRLSNADAEQTLRDYETYAIDLSTGELDRTRPGGYSYVAQVFGRNPLVVSTNNGDARLRAIAERVYASLGARLTLHYHEAGTDPQQPFTYSQGLLVRPSDFSVTRVTAIDGSNDFWWNHMTAGESQRYDPTAILQTSMERWEQQSAVRPAFITALIHENNFYRSGPTGWASIYYSGADEQRARPLSPPYDLTAADLSQARSSADQQAIWQAYENLVAYAAGQLQVVTSEDLLRLAQANETAN